MTMPSLVLSLSKNFIKFTSKRYLSMSNKVVVHVRGKINDDIPKFYSKTLFNARNSLLEPGVNRFDVLSKIESPNEFLLIESYKTLQAADDHKLTTHYNDWREFVQPMMAAPRTSIKYNPLYPPPIGWSTCPSASTNSGSTIEQITFEKDKFTQTVFEGSRKLYKSMFAVFVDIEVKPGTENDFIQATINNCRHSLQEPGIYRFDFLQETADPTKFCLVEVYNTETAPGDHKKTAHYALWAKTVESMMARPRKAEKYATVFPAPLHWHQSTFITHPGLGTLIKPTTSEGEYNPGLKGLNTVTGGSFGFIAPKIHMGRNIATLGLKSAIKDLLITKPFIVTGKNGFSRYHDILTNSLGVLYNPTVSYSVDREPTVEDAIGATKLAIQNKCDGIIAIGGGSALDLGKAIAALVTNPGDIYDHLETIGKGLPIQNKVSYSVIGIHFFLL